MSALPTATAGTTMHPNVTRRLRGFNNASNMLQDKVLEELFASLDTYSATEDVVDAVSLGLLCVGLLCHSLNAIVWSTGTFGSVRFLLYKYITAAELVYCASGTFDGFSRIIFGASDQKLTFVFANRLAAYYTCYVTKFVSSTTSYWVTYLTLALTVERFLAVCFPHVYQLKVKRQKKISVHLFASACLVVAAVFNSWFSPLETPLHTQRSLNDSHILYYMGPKNYTEALNHAFYIANLYNSTIRTGGFLSLLIFTVCIVCARHCHKRKIAKYAAVPSSVPKPMSKRENTFLCLTIAVLVIELIHAVPREMRRIVELLYPQQLLLFRIFDDSGLLSDSERRHSLTIFFLGHHYLSTVGTLALQLDRTCKFCLYLTFSVRVRHAFLDLICCVPCTGKRVGGYRSGNMRAPRHMDEETTSFINNLPSGQSRSTLLRVLSAGRSRRTSATNDSANPREGRNNRRRDVASRNSIDSRSYVLSDG